MKSESLPILAAFAAVLSLPYAARCGIGYYWLGGEGAWTDEAMWENSTVPLADGTVYFTHGSHFSPKNEERASRVMLSPVTSVAQALLGEPHNDWTGIAGEVDTCPVVFAGPARLNLQDRRYSGSNAGRDYVMENVDVVYTNHLEEATLQSDGGWRTQGRGLWRSSSLVMTNSAMYFSVSPGADFVVDGSDIRVNRVSFSDEGARYDLRSGSMRVLSPSTTTLSATNVHVRNATLRYSGNCTAGEWFPQGRDGLLDAVVVSDRTFRPTLAGGEKIALRGKVMATNNTDAIVSHCILTNDVEIYGRGTLNSGFLKLMNGHAFDFDLANFELGYRLYNLANPDGTASAPVLSFRNGVNIRIYDTRPSRDWSGAGFYVPMWLHGNVTFDSRDLYSGETYTLDFTHKLYFRNRSAVEYRGKVKPGYGYVPVRFARYALDAGADVTERDYNHNVACSRRIHDFSLGAGSKLTVLDCQQYLDIAGTVDADPTATIVAAVPANIEGDRLYPVFCSLASAPPPCSVAVNNVTAGYELKWVGGSAYYSNGKKDYGGASTGGRWLGAADGYWSNAANWGGSQKPYAGIDATFCGETRTVVTNDVNDAVCLKLAYTGGAPFVLRGKPLGIRRNGLGADGVPAVYSSGAMPFIVECPLVANGNFGCKTDVNHGAGMIALMGSVDVSAGTFGPCGNIVVGGDVDCRDLLLQKPDKKVQIGYPAWNSISTNFTELTVLAGATVTVSAQTTTNTEAGCIWIDEGGEVSVAGDWRWNTTENEHQIDGLLDLSAAVPAGDAAQGYFGSGVLRVGTTDGSDGASMKLGEGLTLETTAPTWGTMPIDVTSGLVVSNASDWTYAVAGGLKVSGNGHALTVDAAATTVIETGLDGYDFDLVKKGPGKLVVKGGAAGLARGTLDVRAGTVVFDEAQSVRTLLAAPGTKIALSAKDGELASLTVDDDVDLDGVVICPADSASVSALTGRSFRNAVTVPWHCRITGVPEVSGFDFRTVVHADGTSSLQVRPFSGFRVIVR